MIIFQPKFNADHAILLEIWFKGKHFHSWLHSCGEGMPRSIMFLLWQQFFFSRWWISILSWVVIRWLLAYSLEACDWLQCEIYWTFCLCFKWCEDMGSLGHNSPRDGRYVSCHTCSICTHILVHESKVKIQVQATCFELCHLSLLHFLLLMKVKVCVYGKWKHLFANWVYV